MPDHRHPPLTDAQIAEEEALATRYVLGELSEEEFANFEARYASDSGFRERYNRWAAALGDETAEAQQTSGAVGTGGSERALGSRLGAYVSKLGVVPAVIGALVAALLVALVTNMGVLQGQSAVSPTRTVLATEQGELVAEAVFDPEAQSIEVRVMEATPEPGRVFEVWLVEGEGTPRSLGTLSPTQARTLLPLSLEHAASLHGGALVMTQEPDGGAGAAGPTGEVVAAGAFAAP